MGRSQSDEPRQTYVYAIGTADHRHVKIGYTNDPRRRLSGIQTTCPFAVSILWRTEGGALLEGALHKHFADYHRHGEWFDFPAEQNAAELINRAVEEIAAAAAAAAAERAAAEEAAQAAAEKARAAAEKARAAAEEASAAAAQAVEVAEVEPEPIEPIVEDSLAAIADEVVAATLRIPVGSLVIQQQRVIYEDGEPVEVAVSWIRPKRIVSCHMEVLPDGSVRAREPNEKDAELDKLMANNPFFDGGRPYQSCIGPVLPARRARGDMEP